MIDTAKHDEPDYYELLQVSARAEPAIIEVAYRKLAHRYHPDINRTSGAQERMRELNKALEILLDPQRRADYDRRRLRWAAQKAMAEKPLTLITPPLDWDGSPAAGARQSLRRVSPGWVAVAGGTTMMVAAVGLLFAGLGARESGGAQSGTDDGSAQPRATASTAVAAASLAPVETADARPAPATEPPTPAAEEPPVQTTASFSDGRWLVGEEIAPGVWRATPSETCSWQRLSSIEGTSDVIAAAGSYVRIEILPADAAFASEGCGWWVQTLTARSASPENPFSDGTWLVGEEIKPGLWQNSEAAPECRWTRLNRLDGIDSPRNETGSASIVTVEILESNRAFDTRGCGVWKRVGD